MEGSLLKFRREKSMFRNAADALLLRFVSLLYGFAVLLLRARKAA